MDGGDVGGAGEGPDDAGGAQNGEAAEDAEAGVHGALGDALAVVDAHGDGEAAGVPVLGGEREEMLTDHAPRDRINGRFAHGHGQPAARDGAHAGAGAKPYVFVRLRRDSRPDPGTVGGVGVVAAVLDDAGFRTVVGGGEVVDGHLGAAVPRQRNVNGFQANAGERQPGGGHGRGGSAHAGGEAGAQRPAALRRLRAHGWAVGSALGAHGRDRDHSSAGTGGLASCLP